MPTGRTAFPVLALLCAAAIAAAADEAPSPTGATAAPAASAAGRVDAARVAAADAEPGEWLVHGRTFAEQRFSPLDTVDTENVDGLGLAWSFPMGTRRGLEATPIVVDGVMYLTGTWSVVHALDAKTGERLWTHDPRVPRAKGRDACCDVVNRGVAVWKGRVYVGTLDGRLVALDAATGEPVWETSTFDPGEPYTITGAPRIAAGRVVIGNGGAEFGVRGYFSAYDTDTGELLWRFYTVPASKEGPHEHPELAAAAETWPADALWEAGLGGTAWDSMAYDPELGLLYVGTGNSSVYDRAKRSPGGGDNLFISSILALRPETGRLVWHYQTTPGEHWDYTATQHMILADLEIGGAPRKVLMQAPKNGFFYVLDRATGELLSAKSYVHVSWATRVDLETGRPVERPQADWSQGPAFVSPSVVGAHNWHPMSFHPPTGLVFLPAIDMVYRFLPDADFAYTPGRFNTGEDFEALARETEGLEDTLRATCSPTQLVAWDPVAQRARWRVPADTGIGGGVLSTAGGLAFQGNGAGVFRAYHAPSGRILWEEDVGVGIMAPPVTYRVDGEQYVAVLAGLGGSQGGHFVRLDDMNDGHVLAWKLGGEAALPEVPRRPEPVVHAPARLVEPERVARGRGLYANHCQRCHGVGTHASGLYPDLRFAPPASWDKWNAIVLDGLREGGGMAGFADVLTPEQSLDIRAYVASRAHHEPTPTERVAAWLADRACLPARWIAD